MLVVSEYSEFEMKLLLWKSDEDSTETGRVPGLAYHLLWPWEGPLTLNSSPLLWNVGVGLDFWDSSRPKLTICGLSFYVYPT